jgi:hypothetical protein
MLVSIDIIWATDSHSVCYDSVTNLKSTFFFNVISFFQLYDRLGRHAYQPRPEDKSGNDTTSESDDDRSRRQ